MYLIILLGLILRLSFVDKFEGLWNDEYVSWMIASTPFNDGFWSEVLKQCHMPLYYLYLKPFANCSDLILRLTSLVPGMISICIMYLVGREYSKKNGYIAALITSSLSFLIYYSQEVRFYSLLFLLSSISLLFTIKLIKKFNKINLIGYIISSILILFTHVLGFIYVFLNLIYIVYKRKKISIKMILFSIFILILLLPFGINILNMLPSSQWWGNFSYTNILFLFSDYLSPILTNHINAPPVFFYDRNITIWITLPTIIGFIAMCFGIKNNKGISAIALFAIIVMSILAMTHKIVFISKYLIEILPIIIILLSMGFIRLKKIGIILLTIFILFHISCLFTPFYVTKLPRTEGHRLVCEVLKKHNSNTIIFTYYEPNRFDRYIDLNNKNTLYISKINRFDYLDNPSKILDKIKGGESVSVVFLDSVSFVPYNKINDYENKIPEMFITFSKIKHSILEKVNIEYKDCKIDTIGSWTVISGIKK